MCFHTEHTKKVKEVELKYDVKISNEEHRTLFDQPQFHLNGFTHPNMLVIPQAKPNVLAPAVWGIVPENKSFEEIKPYYKDAVRFGGGLNAQSEKLFNHFIYKSVYKTQRCIIPVSGFFEPHEHLKKKYPYYIHREDRNLISLAGIYTVIDTYITFSILTKKASPLFESIHNVKKRQPVLLKEEFEKEWINSDLDNDGITEIINSTFQDSELESYTISKDLFIPKIDSNNENITNKVYYDELNTLF